MTEKGMISIDNPSEFFMTKRSEDDNVSGSALTVVKEGTRPIILEIESLVSHSFTPYPSRISDTLKRDHLNTLISVLEQRGGINLYDKNVVIKTTGGIKLKDQASNLATIISIASSCYDIKINTDTVFLADVGLTGELKKIPSLEPRLREAERMGIKKAYVADEVRLHSKFSSLNVIKRKSLKDVLIDFFK
jgi:DNA repair protein RadA/Sms